MSKISVSVDNIKWSSVAKALAFSFVSGATSFFVAAGGFSVEAGFSGAVALIGGGFVAGINGVLFTLYQSVGTKAE